MPTTITTSKTLNNGIQMPLLGFGTWQLEQGDETKQAVTWAIEAGYRHVDTAAIYKNEESVGEAINQSGVPREDIFVTTKCWNGDMRDGRVVEAFEESLGKLQMDYVDLYLLHWAVGNYVDCWQKMQVIYESGRAKAIGVSNFMVSHLDKLLPTASVVPAVNQIEWHPKLQSPELCAYCRDKGIAVEAWSPLMRGEALDIPRLIEIGKAHGKTSAQILLRWGIERDVIVIPKSRSQKRIIENADLYDFTLTEKELADIDGLDTNKRMGPDPEHVEF